MAACACVTQRRRETEKGTEANHDALARVMAAFRECAPVGRLLVPSPLFSVPPFLCVALPNAAACPSEKT